LFYTISFCMSICLVSKIVGNFILIKYNYEESRSVKKAMVKK
jgi:hypothetical protein